MKEIFSVEKFEQIFAGSQIGIWTRPDIEKDDYVWSDRLYEIIERKPGKFPASHQAFRDLIYEEDLPRVKEKMEAHLENDEPYEVDYRIIRPDGSYKWVQSSGQIFHDEESGVHGMSGILMDIDLKKQGQIRVQNAVELFYIAEELAHMGNFTWDRDSGALIFSRGAKKILGFQPEDELSLDSFMEIVLEEDRERIGKIIAEHSEKGEDITLSYRIVSPDGKLVYINSHATLRQEAEKKTTLYHGVLRDCSTEIEFRNQREALITNLERSNKELEQFAYVASHDLQEPLRKIQMFGERLMTRKEHLEEKDTLYVERMQNAAQRMQTLIRDLLEFSRAARIQKRDEKVDLNEVLSSVTDDLAIKAEEAGATLEIGELPVIYGNQGQLYRLWLNLISNSIKFRHQDRAPVIKMDHKILSRTMLETLDLGILQHTRYHCITLCDNGIGFDNSYRDKIFTIFQRLHGRNEYDGTGIGLAICKKIVENHEGFIRADSKPSEGSILTIFLPKLTRRAATSISIPHDTDRGR